MIKPTRGYVLIEPTQEETTSGGFIVPDNAKEKPQKGVVLGIGILPGLDSNPCKQGDNVYYNRWSGSDITEDGKEYKIVKFEDVLAVIE